MKTHKKLQVVMYCCLCLYSVTGDPGMSPPLEFPRALGETRANKLSFPNSNFPPRAYHVPQQQIIHTGAMQSQPVPTAEKVQTENSDFYFNEMKEFSGVTEEENQKLRTANRVDDVNKHQSSNGYARQNIDSWSPLTHESASTNISPTTILHQSTNKASPKFDLLEPITTKMSGKMDGFMSLVMALLGSGSDNMLMKGFKEVIIDGMIKPMMLVKGGLKILISKLSIPIISLLLINLEVLISVWWLWDDCPQPQPVPYHHLYPQPVIDNYSYNATYK